MRYITSCLREINLRTLNRYNCLSVGYKSWFYL
jgi:hypothetical protein